MRSVASLAVLAALAGHAHAGDDRGTAIENDEHRFRLDLPASWTEVAPAPGPEHIVASYVNRATEQTLAVTRVDFPNFPAWRQKREYFDAVEAGFREASSDYRKRRVRRRKLGRVPAMDLQFERRRGDEREAADVRVIFFRTYSLTLVIVGPDRPSRRVARATRAIVDGFRPFFGH